MPLSATARSWWFWGAGAVAYLMAVVNRTSFGVAGLEAAHRFHVSPSTLAGFAVVQLSVYAAWQVPVGLLVDRYGVRALLLTGSVTMALGQAALALAPNVPLAYLGRIAMGTGDAFMFISVLRLVSMYFPARRAPMMTQITGMVGQCGQIISGIPVLALLHAAGWVSTFLTLALATMVTGLFPLALPGRGERPLASSHLWLRVREVWTRPGTRLGAWTHAVSQTGSTVFLLMWGYPFLVRAEGFSPGEAGRVFVAMTAVMMISNPVLGLLTQRFPLRRSWLVLGIVAVMISSWSVLLAWPGPAPHLLVTLAALSLAVGGPTSMIGFDFARTFNTGEDQGVASGMVNAFGFVVSLVSIAVVGAVLQIHPARLISGTSAGVAPGASGDYGLGDFRWAWLVLFIVWTLGAWQVRGERSRARQAMAASGIKVPRMRDSLARRLNRH